MTITVIINVSICWNRIVNDAYKQLTFNSIGS